MRTDTSVRGWLAFVLANAFVAIFFDAFWLLGYRIQALDDLSAKMGWFQLVLWFACFFMASYFSLNAVSKTKERIMRQCLAFAIAFSFLLWCLVFASNLVLAPFIDPWF